MCFKEHGSRNDEGWKGLRWANLGVALSDLGRGCHVVAVPSVFRIPEFPVQYAS